MSTTAMLGVSIVALVIVADILILWKGRDTLTFRSLRDVDLDDEVYRDTMAYQWRQLAREVRTVYVALSIDVQRLSNWCARHLKRARC